MIAAILPARGGSSRIPRKNIRDFFGRPIIAYPIKAALGCKAIGEIIVTTDDLEIADVAQQLGAEVVFREQDDGTKGTQEVAKDVLMMRGEITEACVIYPCSPLLTASDLDRGYALLQRPGALFAMSVQTSPLADAGCFYWGRAEAFKVDAPLIDAHTVMVPMPASRVQDINTQEDWDRAERLYAAWKHRRVA